MKKIILVLTVVIIATSSFAQSKNGNSINTKDIENVNEKTLGNLIIQTLPLAVGVEIPQLGYVGYKTQEYLILEELETGEYTLVFTFKRKKFQCVVEVLNQKITHLIVDVKKRKFEILGIKPKLRQPDPSLEASIPLDSIPIDPKAVFVIVDEMPEFPGGQLELQKWIAMSVRYPVEAQQKGITGRVFVTFVINKEGRAIDVRIIRPTNSLLDAEAVRVVRCMPVWKPGRHEGELVNVSYTIPINFQLQ
ncbi:energy transducer TonB [Marinifilum fragile]|uniref:energy transducer TonB n=1 Tax=Marinifilum fragile TaxID=570161 RepID=UPI002AA792CE|nr:energy transducer TonB [Marinifilum fragile]